MPENHLFFIKNYKSLKNYFLKYIPSSYAKILGETKFQPRDFPRAEQKKIGENNDQLRIHGSCRDQNILFVFKTL